jgi:hypothetical protein
MNQDNFADVIVSSVMYERGALQEGAVFVFHGSASGIADTSAPLANTIIDSNQSGSMFGSSLAAGILGGNDTFPDLVVGAKLYDQGQTDEGAVFVFRGTATGIASGNASTAVARLESNLAGAFFGTSVAILPRINNDAFGDIAVGAPGFESPMIPDNTKIIIKAGTTATENLPNTFETDEGVVFIFHGTSALASFNNATPATASTVLQGNGAGTNVGVSIASAGDVNRDGFTDLVIGAPGLELRSPDLTGASVEGDEGNAFVFHGRSGGIPSNTVDLSTPLTLAKAQTWEATSLLPAIANTTIDANSFQVSMGATVAGIGDLNGDGFDDIEVSAPRFGRPEDGPSYEGRVYGFLGSATGVGPSATQISRPVNVSGSRFTISQIVLGLSGNSPANADFSIKGNQLFASLGEAVAAGDVNGDGVSDLIVASQFYSAGQDHEGAVFVYLGIPSGSGGGTGAGVSRPSDLDADGIADRVDNCIFAANPSQLDADGDGCGNACDADVDQSGSVTVADASAITRCYGKRVLAQGGPRVDPTCEESDLNGSGSVTSADLGILRRQLGLPPGPGANCR